jgi:hypothetical protein
MVEDILLEIAIFTFTMVIIGIGLTIYEFKHIIKDYEKTKKAKPKKNSGL